MEYKVEILEEASKFILKLEPKMQAKVQYSIKLLEEFGYLLTEPHSKKVTGKKELYELRVKVGTDICRLFYFFWKNKTYIILSGYVKKENKLKKSEIEKAMKLLKLVKETL